MSPERKKLDAATTEALEQSLKKNKRALDELARR